MNGYLASPLMLVQRAATSLVYCITMPDDDLRLNASDCFGNVFRWRQMAPLVSRSLNMIGS
jgi:hypothetical protein